MGTREIRRLASAADDIVSNGLERRLIGLWVGSLGGRWREMVVVVIDDGAAQSSKTCVDMSLCEVADLAVNAGFVGEASEFCLDDSSTCWGGGPL